MENAGKCTNNVSPSMWPSVCLLFQAKDTIAIIESLPLLHLFFSFWTTYCPNFRYPRLSSKSFLFSLMGFFFFIAFVLFQDISSIWSCRLLILIETKTILFFALFIELFCFKISFRLVLETPGDGTTGQIQLKEVAFVIQWNFDKRACKGCVGRAFRIKLQVRRHRGISRCSGMALPAIIFCQWWSLSSVQKGYWNSFRGQGGNKCNKWACYKG